MAMVTKALKGLGKAFTMKNTIKGNDGGWSSLLIPRQVNAAGAALIVGGGALIGVGHEGVKGHNAMKLGKVSYGGMARMTGSYNSGAVQAMHRASGGNYAAFSDMAEEVVGGRLETYGATPELISSLYHMGGR